MLRDTGPLVLIKPSRQAANCVSKCYSQNTTKVQYAWVSGLCTKVMAPARIHLNPSHNGQRCMTLAPLKLAKKSMKKYLTRTIFGLCAILLSGGAAAQTTSDNSSFTPSSSPGAYAPPAASSGSGSVSNEVPEPGTLPLVGVALVGVITLVRYVKRKK